MLSTLTIKERAHQYTEVVLISLCLVDARDRRQNSLLILSERCTNRSYLIC